VSELKQFKLPDVGEGLTEADIVRWHVQPGDKVTVNQIIVEIETAKAVVELPSPYEGVVASLLVPEGTTADVGTPIIAVEVGPDAGGGEHPPAPRASTSADLVPPPPAEGAVEPGLHGSPAPKEHEERQAVLVGYGVKPGTTVRRARKPSAGRSASGEEAASAGRSASGGQPASAGQPAASASSASSVSSAPAAPVVRAVPAATGEGADDGGTAAADGGSDLAVLAKPPVRKLARDLGIDLSRVPGTGPGGSITRDDVQSAARGEDAAGSAAAGSAAAGEPATAPAAPFAGVTAVAREERIPIRGVRKHTAAAMVGSAFSAPHVTEFLQIDITETMAATARLRMLPEFSEIRVSPLLLVARALMVAVARHPMINSSWDEEAQEIVVRHYVNLGIAAATERGLIVPNIRDAHALSLPGLARALAELTETARAGKATPADLRGGTITITNVGVFGVDTGTPILTPGEAAILAFGRVKDSPWVREGQLAVRKVTTLALSFDHRIVDGDLGSAVLRDIGAMLEDPLRMLAWS
jgi:pyruvate dehydrogenase E2 component (dihydrolipoamide acetyltransferase)